MAKNIAIRIFITYMDTPNTPVYLPTKFHENWLTHLGTILDLFSQKLNSFLGFFWRSGNPDSKQYNLILDLVYTNHLEGIISPIFMKFGR